MIGHFDDGKLLSTTSMFDQSGKVRYRREGNRLTGHEYHGHMAIGQNIDIRSISYSHIHGAKHARARLIRATSEQMTMTG